MAILRMLVIYSFRTLMVLKYKTLERSIFQRMSPINIKSYTTAKEVINKQLT